MCISGFGQTPCTQWGLLTASGCCGLDDDVRCKAAMPLQSPQVTSSVSPHVAAMGRGWVLNSAGGTCALRPVRTCKLGPLWGGGVFPCGQKAGAQSIHWEGELVIPGMGNSQLGSGLCWPSSRADLLGGSPEILSHGSCANGAGLRLNQQCS